MIDDDNQAILQLLHEHQEAIARSDPAGIVAAMAEDVVQYDLPPPLEYRGPAARDAAALDAWFATWTDGVTV